MIEWRETCVVCGGRGHWISAASGVCVACDGLGSIPVPGAPSFSLEQTLADFEPGDIVVIGTGDKVRIQWHVPKKAGKVVPITTFVGEFSADFGSEELELSNPIPLPSTFGVRKVIESRAAGDANDGKGDAVDPLARRTRAGGLI